MKQRNIQFRIFDSKAKKYLAPDNQFFIGLDGKLYILVDNVLSPLPEPDKENFPDELAYTIGIKDVNGKEAYSDDLVALIYKGKASIAFLAFVEESRSWKAIIDGSFTEDLTEFEILPNREERNQEDKEGGRIMATWEAKAKELQNAPAPAPAPTPQQPEPAPAQQDQPVKAATATKLTAAKLQHIPTEIAPKWWLKLAGIAEARPKHNNAKIELRRLVDTNLAVWYLGRGDQWSSASDMFLVTEHVIEEAPAEAQAQPANEDTGTK